MPADSHEAPEKTGWSQRSSSAGESQDTEKSSHALEQDSVPPAPRKQTKDATWGQMTIMLVSNEVSEDRGTGQTRHSCQDTCAL